MAIAKATPPVEATSPKLFRMVERPASGSGAFPWNTRKPALDAEIVAD